MRHGEKDGDKLTELGVRQVEAAARTHLPRRRLPISRDPGGWSISGGYYSGMERARQTLTCALKAVDATCGFQVEPAFGFNWLLDANLPAFDFVKAEQELEAKLGGAMNVTAYDWLEAWPPAWGIRERFLNKMLHIAEKPELYLPTHQLSRSGRYNFLVATHSPLGEMAIPNPKEAPRLGFADIVKYTIRLTTEGKACLVKHKVLRCPAL